MAQDYEELIQRLETDGESKVRSMRASGSWIGIDAQRVDLWLSSKDAEREAASSAKRDARSEETLAIAKEANRLASEANLIARTEAASAARSARYTMYAAMIAAISAVIANKAEIIALLSVN